MANQKQLEILMQGVEVWCQWRKEHPDEKIDLQYTKLQRLELQRLDLSYVDLQYVNLHHTKLQGADLRYSDLQHANLWWTELQHANLRGANLRRADLQYADLQHADLQDANLRNADLQSAKIEWANLQGVNLRGARLNSVILDNATITGAILYGTARDDWKINDVKCDYVYWDEVGKERTPKDRDFQPGEFEELYKSLPTFEYYFKYGFTLLDAVIMDKIVQAINEQHPEFDLQLKNFEITGTPHATFTVSNRSNLEKAVWQVSTDYEGRIAALEGKQEQLMQLMSKLVGQQYNITANGDVIIKQAGGDIVEQDKIATNVTGNVKQLASGKEINQKQKNHVMMTEIWNLDKRLVYP